MMFVDIYLIGHKNAKEHDPHLISLDHDSLLDPEGSCCKGFFSKEGIEEFSEFFVPGGINRNGLEKRIPRGSIAESSLIKNLSRTATTIDRGRGPVIEKYGVGAPENIHMMNVERSVGGMLSFLDYALKNDLDFLSVTHNANPQGYRLDTNGNRAELPSRKDPVRISCLCDIYSAKIETVDPESETYTGIIQWGDNMERCYPTTSFVAHPIPVGADFRGEKRLHLRGIGKNTFAGEHHLTAQSSVNKDMEKYVNETISERVY